MTLEECRGVAWACFAVFSIVRGTDKGPVFQCMARCPLSILRVHIWIIPTESGLSPLSQGCFSDLLLQPLSTLR